MLNREKCWRWSVASPGRTPDRKWTAGMAVPWWRFMSCLRHFLTYMLRVPISEEVRRRGQDH